MQKLPFNPNINTHNHNTRIHYNIRQMKPYHEYARKCLRYHIPFVINNVPLEIFEKIDTHNIEGSSGYIKLRHLQSYQDNCIIVDCYTCSRNYSILYP